jgi:hypothetical protein
MIQTQTLNLTHINNPAPWRDTSPILSGFKTNLTKINEFNEIFGQKIIYLQVEFLAILNTEDTEKKTS